MIFTVVFKVMIFKTVFTKLSDKKEGSFEVSDIIAKVKKLYTISKSVPSASCSRNIAKRIHGKTCENRLKCAPLPANTIKNFTESITKILKK